MRHVDHLLIEYYDNELPGNRRRQVQGHLSACPACRAELESLSRLSDALAACGVPDTPSSPEAFRARVMLKLRRPQAVRARYVPSLAWLTVPASLVGILLILQGLLVLSGTMGWFLNLAGWSGIDAVVPLKPVFSQSILASSVALGDVVELSALDLLRAAWWVVLYLGLILVFVAYVGWVSILWRTTAHARDSGRSR